MEKNTFSDIDKNLISLVDLLAKELPPCRWYSENLIPFGITMLSAPSGRYKTWITIQMAMEICNGLPSFGRFENEFEPTGVLFVNEEMNISMIQRRFQLISGRFEKNNVQLVNMAGIKIDDNNGTTEYLINVCKQYDLGFVIFDSLTRIHNKNENSSNEVKAVYDELKKFIKDDISVLFTHHHRKPSDKGTNHDVASEARGSSDWHAMVDSHIVITNANSKDRILTIKQTKPRDFDEGEVDCIHQLNIIKEEGSLRFMFGESTSLQKEEMKRRKEREEIIIDFILKNPNSDRDEISNGTGITIKRLNDELPVMETYGKIFSKKAKFNKKNYFIKDIKNSQLTID